MTPTIKADDKEPVEIIYTAEDVRWMEIDRKRARLLVTLQTIAALLVIAFYLRAVFRND